MGALMQKRIILPIVFLLFISIFSCTRTEKVVEVRYAPVLYDLASPDSIQRNSPYIYYVFVTAYDPDGLQDIDSVYFRVTRPDGSLNPNILKMRDDGQYGDSVANDGRFSLGFTSGDTASQLGIYIFKFYAKDKAGDVSNSPQAEITEY
jgi:hypothetical protein